MRTMSSALLSFVSMFLLAIPLPGCDPADAEEQAWLDEDIEDPEQCLDPDRIYVSEEPEVCRAVLFVCEPGMVIFKDACGCGCVTLPQVRAPGRAAGSVTADRP